MLKLFTITVLFYLLYRLVFKSTPGLSQSEENPSIEEDSEIVDIDYEDVDP